MIQTGKPLSSFFLTLSAIFWCLFVSPVIAGIRQPPNYHLAISFDLERATLTGTARIDIPAGNEIELLIDGLNITGMIVEQKGFPNKEAKPADKKILQIPVNSSARTIYISYTKTISQSYSNRISKDGITLLQNWFPQPNNKMYYHLTARLPNSFTAVTQAESFPLTKKGNTVYAAFPEPLDTIHFIAAPYETRKVTVRDGLDIYTLFYPEDSNLSEMYLQKGRDYILRYEKEIGPFPYDHFVIAANKLPTGLGMGSFTLLGQSVLRLPFIVDTSLGHEIVHAWFGNAVDVEYESGSWCEGLTSYLADHAFRMDVHEGSEYRKESIINYLSYVNADNSQPLTIFRSAGHMGGRERVLRGIGYSRSVMMFHELNTLIGNEHFRQGVRLLYKDFKGKKASWNDIQRVFEISSGQDLVTFFQERLSRTDLPDLAVENISLKSTQDGVLLRFTIKQRTEKPYSLKIPIRVTTALSHYSFYKEINTLTNQVDLNLPERPLEFSLDPDYSFLRILKEDEFPATWSRFLGSDKKLVILNSEQKNDIYRPILKHLAESDWKMKFDHEVTNSELSQNDLLFLGSDQKAYRTLFGINSDIEPGFTMKVRKNPLNNSRVVVSFSSPNLAESTAVTYRLSHYGKYSFLHFKQGKILRKNITESKSGIVSLLEKLPGGGKVPPSSDFLTITKELANQKVIYAGESHTSASDHRMQLRLIEYLAASVPHLAIGMEMFPESSQSALDEYTLGDGSMTEHEFLKKSRYFSVWSYDYRFFREIFTLARQKKIPVIGLNLDRTTVSTVFRTGTTDELPADIKESLPPDRDLTLPGYTERLSKMYAVHDQAGHATGKPAGFIQAQALWDETMAARLVKYIKTNPETTIVVLAGSQHTRKDSGIPPRVARYLDIKQASVINLTSGDLPTNLDKVADYYFLGETIDLPEQGKIGLVLKEFKNDKVGIQIDEITQESKAGLAGLKEGDIVTSINSVEIHDMDDVRIAMLDLLPGERVRIQVERKDGIAPTFSAEVELIGPRQTGHP